MNLAEAHVLVTGGGRGIGRYLVERFRQDASSVVVLEKDASLCEEVIRESAGRNVVARACDVADPDSIDRVLGEEFARGFVPDVLLNNAGVIHSEPLVNLLSKSDRVHSRDAWHRVIST